MTRTKYELIYYYQDEVVKITTASFDDQEDLQNEVNKIGESSLHSNLAKSLLGIENWDTISINYNDTLYYYHKIT